MLDFLLEDENVQAYLDAQKAVPCKEGDFELPSTLEGMKEYIKEGKMSDYQDHYYPSEMAVDAQIQTFLMKKDSKAFLKKFDTDWELSLIHISEPTRRTPISNAVFCLKKKKNKS